MSYVHDILLDLDFDRAAFTAAVADIRTLFRRAELPIVGPSGRPGTMPVLDDDFIGFNGVNQNCVCDPGDPDYHSPEDCLGARCRSSRRGDDPFPAVRDRPEAGPALGGLELVGQLLV